MNDGLNLIEPRITPPLDKEFRPAALANRAFRQAVAASGEAVPLVIGLEREGGLRSVYTTSAWSRPCCGFGADGRLSSVGQSRLEGTSKRHIQKAAPAALMLILWAESTRNLSLWRSPRPTLWVSHMSNQYGLAVIWRAAG